MLDINNIYVNSVNHDYDPVAFLRQLPGERIAYAHIAGHSGAAPEVIVDTHGTPVVDPVWDLLDTAYEHFGVFPTMLERDENIPPLDEVLVEVERIRRIQAKYAGTDNPLLLTRNSELASTWQSRHFLESNVSSHVIFAIRRTYRPRIRSTLEASRSTGTA